MDATVQQAFWKDTHNNFKEIMEVQADATPEHTFLKGDTDDKKW